MYTMRKLALLITNLALSIIMVSIVVGTRSLLHFWQISMFTPAGAPNIIKYQISSILGPYFGCRGSLFGPYFVKIWVPIGSLFLSSQVPDSFAHSAFAIL